MISGRVPVLVGQVEVAGVGGARREVLEDPITEVRRREVAVRVLDRRSGYHERAPRPTVVGRLRDVDVADLVLVQVEAALEGDVDRAVGADRRVDVRVPGSRGRGRRQLYRPRERLAPVARDGDHNLAGVRVR